MNHNWLNDLYSTDLSLHDADADADADDDDDRELECAPSNAAVAGDVGGGGGSFFYGEEAEMYSIAEDSREDNQSEVTPGGSRATGGGLANQDALRSKLGSMQEDIGTGGDEEQPAAVGVVWGGDEQQHPTIESMGIETCIVDSDDDLTKMSDDQIHYYHLRRNEGRRRRCRLLFAILLCIALLGFVVTFPVLFTKRNRRDSSRSRSSSAMTSAENGSPSGGEPPPERGNADGSSTEPPPTVTPTNSPTQSSAVTPTDSTTDRPTTSPAFTPTESPTRSPAISPTAGPAASPTDTPRNSPTRSPTNPPTDSPTRSPTNSPTDGPTNSPTNLPTTSPTKSPTATLTDGPTTSPTATPTNSPTTSPTKSPTANPTDRPTLSPTGRPAASPTTDAPTGRPTQSSAQSPTDDLYQLCETYVMDSLKDCQGPQTFFEESTRQGLVFRDLVDEVFSSAALASDGGMTVQGLHSPSFLREKYALDNLYMSTYGYAWTLKENWMTWGDPCDGWHGVECQSSRIPEDSCAVTGVVLANNAMYGELPEEFCCMPCLQDIDMSDNELAGGTLQCLYQIMTLKSLKFDGNNFGFDPVAPP